jgi:hypothetical protein
MAASDNFNRANGGLGSNWTQNVNSWTIESNQARPNTGGSDCLIRWSAEAFDAAQYSQVVIKNPSGTTWYGVAVRCATSAVLTCYSYACSSSERELAQYINGSWTRLGNSVVGAGSAANNDVFKLEANGSSIKPYRNGSLDTSITPTGVSNSNIPSGAIGMFGNGNVAGGGVGVDDFEGDNIAAPPDPLSLKWQGLVIVG